jgi:hypothetical protein
MGNIEIHTNQQDEKERKRTNNNNSPFPTSLIDSVFGKKVSTSKKVQV